MAMYKIGERTVLPTKKRTSIGDGLRKRGSYKSRGKKPYRGQGK